jgi:hypothetical protein
MDTKEEEQITQTDQRGKTDKSGASPKASKSRKCHQKIEDISYFGRALSKSEKTTWTEIQLNIRYLQL